MTAIGFLMTVIGFGGLLIVSDPFSIVVTRLEILFGAICWLGVIFLAAGISKILWDVMP